MGSASNTVFWISLSGLFILSVVSYLRDRKPKRLLFYMAVLVVCGGIYLFIFQKGLILSSKIIISSKGTQKGAQGNELSFIIILYIFMLIGMVFHYFYNYFTKPVEKRRPFDLGSLLAPIFASPIVFVPLLGAFQSTEIDISNLTLPKYMTFFVAFQNGFFWKEIVDNHGKEKKK